MSIVSLIYIKGSLYNYAASNTVYAYDWYAWMFLRESLITASK